MKKYTYLFLLSIISFLSCSNSEDSKETIYLRVPDDAKTLNYSNVGQSANITIETNCNDWTIQSDREEWCTVERLSSNKQIFIVHVTANHDNDIRQATLTLKAAALTETIKVSQLGATPAILLSPESIENVAATQTETTLKVTTNLSDYRILIPEEAGEWVTITKVEDNTRAMVAYNYTVCIKSNPAPEPRSTVVEIKNTKNNGNPTVTLPISQNKRSTDPGDVVVEGDIKVVPTGGKDNQHHAGQGIENTFDGKINDGNPYHSPWSTDKPGTVFPVVLEYYFDGTQDIDYIIYHPNGGNGNFGKFKLYVAGQDSKEYALAGEYNFMEGGKTRKITLDKSLMKATKIKFEISSGFGGFASCSEMEFYKRNVEKEIHRQLLTVFTSLTCHELRPDVTNKEFEALPGFFANLAIKMKNGTLDEWEQSFRIRDYQPYSNPDEWASKLMTKRYSNLDNITGISVTKGEELILLVGDTHGQEIAVQCIYDEKSGDHLQTSSSGDMYYLDEGVNKIEIKNNGMLFVMYTADPSEKPIKIHIPIGGGEVSGFFDLKEHKTDAKYSELLGKATYKYFAVRGERIMFYFHTEKMKEHVRHEILSAIGLWDNFIGWQQELMGIDDVRPAKFNNHILAISPEGSYMWASDYKIGFVYTYLGNILLYDKVMAAEDNAWGPAHEIGHIHQAAINWPGSTESSNNLFSNYTIYKLGKYKSRGRGLCQVAKARYADAQAWWNMGNATHQNEDTEVHMRMNWQLWTYFHRCGYDTNFWQKLFKLLREDANRVPESNPGRKQMVFCMMAGKAANTNLTEFFDQWGFFVPVNERISQYGTFDYVVTEAMISEAKAYLSQFPAPKHALQYIEDRENKDFNSNDYRSRESGDVGHYTRFEQNTQITQIPTYTLSGRSTTVHNGDEAVAFEWREGNEKGKILYFANTFTFDVPENISLNGAKLYAVQADGKRIELKLK